MHLGLTVRCRTTIRVHEILRVVEHSETAALASWE
jgi:hypothetical protein